ncbi:hypothetical protein PQE20_27490 (plasmid) [Vibrio harveyi]|uniref:phage baseplate protein n=1 Tax=Vibrio harveyi TaxID=669 RepID=UPI00234C17EC|nr:hypothetical protein [Vibrio harveyi]WCP84225.1 hypothetical protein PQE20_27490 [Vibrio harveyi]
MAIISILQAYNPSISFSSDGNESVAEFDAEYNMQLLTRTTITKYPVETGQEVAGSLIVNPSEIKFSWGIGIKKVTSLLSTDFVEKLTTNPLGLAGGFVSNFIDSGIANFLIGALADSTLLQTEKQSRAFLAMKVLQQAQLWGIRLVITIEGLGQLKNMMVNEVRVSRSGKDGGKIMFDITMSQIIVPSESAKDDQLNGKVYGGVIKGVPADE